MCCLGVFSLLLCSCHIYITLSFLGQAATRLETCRSTCDTRLQSAALDSHVPSSLSPSAVDSPFLRREANSPSTFQGRVPDQPPSTGGKVNSSRLVQIARPRRLPALIKILTGFGDDSVPSTGSKPVVARTERPQYVPNQRRRSANANEPLSHEETVQIAAAAAAAAVFSKSIGIFGNNRMSRVNSEWDEALRWIAGWDQQQHMSPTNTKSEQPPIRNRGSSSAATNNNGGVSNNDDSQEGFDNFVGDLARMLESCITQCVEDEHFETRLGEEVSTGSLSIISMVLRSIFGWASAASISKTLRNLVTISAESRLTIARAFHLVGTTVAMYAIHSLWVWGSPSLYHWYASLGYIESPEWLLEHENELTMAKSSRAKQKKKKKKQANRQSRSKATQSNDDRLQRASSAEKPPSGHRPIHSSRKSEEIPSSYSDEQEVETSDWQPAFHSTGGKAATKSKELETSSQDSGSTTDIPSMISYTASASITSSPSIKPIGSNLGDRALPYGTSGLQQGRPRPVLRLNSPLGGSFLTNLPQKKPLAVPTQEQRNEAAKQLREFQAAQIQRILLQRKLAQSSSRVSRLSVVSQQSSKLPPRDSFYSTENTSTEPSIKPNKAVLKPPPGLSHPSAENAFNLDHSSQTEKAFLTDNELILSKLLDDEDDDIAVPSTAPSNTPTGIEAMSPELSLDPSAAPFVASIIIDDAKVPTTESKKEKEEDAWNLNPDKLLRKESGSPMTMKGVYGGSVW